VVRTSNHLAVACLFFGAAFAAFVSGSLEQRIGNLFSFGLMPAVGLYAVGHILGQLLVFGVELGDMIYGMLLWACRALGKRSLKLGRHAISNWPTGRPHQAKVTEVTPGAPFRSRAAEFTLPRDRSDQAQDTCKHHVCMAQSQGLPMTTNFGCSRRLRRLTIIGVSLTTFGLGWLGGYDVYWPPGSQREESSAATTIDAVVERIIGVESDGDPNAKNKRSSATGLGQFLDETWLDMIRAHRPDLAKGRSQTEILELRRDAKVAREITARFTERNAEMLRKRGLPVTPGTLYLAHFAGGAGAVAVLLAMENADAALVMATADATGQTKREKIIKANPFLERFTVADLRNWADRKMQVPGS
jgi:hypothetical protein